MPKYNKYLSVVKPTQVPFTFWVLYEKKCKIREGI